MSKEILLVYKTRAFELLVAMIEDTKFLTDEEALLLLDLLEEHIAGLRGVVKNGDRDL